MEFEPHRSRLADFIAVMLIVCFGAIIGLLLGVYACYAQIKGGVLDGQGSIITHVRF